MLARLMAESGLRPLCVDCDPQGHTSFYLGCSIGQGEPSLLEVLERQISAAEAIYSLDSGIDLIPADNALYHAERIIGDSSIGGKCLQKRLNPVLGNYDCVLLDAPPGRSWLSVAVACIADRLLLPAEASSKGVSSIHRTLELVGFLAEEETFEGDILGILPFFDRWAGNRRTVESRQSIECFRQIAGNWPVLPAVRSSEKYKQALRQRCLPSTLGDYKHLEDPLQEVVGALRGSN